jgi:hypothetical protein
LTAGFELGLAIRSGLGIGLPLGFFSKTTVVLGRLGDVDSFLCGLFCRSSCKSNS